MTLTRHPSTGVIEAYLFSFVQYDSAVLCIYNVLLSRYILILVCSRDHVFFISCDVFTHDDIAVTTLWGLNDST